MSSQDGEKLGCERLGKLLFLKLDPTLQNLLAVLQQHQEIVENSSKSDDLTAGSDAHNYPIIGSSVPRQLEHEERILGFHRAEIDLLQNMQRILQEFQEEPLVIELMNSLSSSKQHLAGSIAILMDYISLPLVAILRRPLTETLDFQMGEGDEAGALRKLQIRQGAERKSITIAAQTLKLCLEMTFGCPSLEKASSSSMALSQSKLLQLVLACSSGLPTGREITEQSTSSFLASGLDRGEQHIESLLDAITCILKFGARTSSIEANSNQTGSFEDELVSAMDGSLLAHLADVCVSIVAPPSMFSEATSLMALNTLLLLLEVVPNVSMWRSLFPGCFASLFRTLVNGLRSVVSTPQSKSKIVCSGLKAFTKLLRLTLQGTPCGEEGITKWTLAELQRIARSDTGVHAAKMVGSANQRKVLGESSASNQQPTEVAQPNPDESFLSEINKRLPGCMTVLAKLLRTAQSPMIRREAADLYQVILIETRSTWDRDRLQDMVLLSLESSLILLKDSDESVVESARLVLEEYQRTAGCKNDMNQFLAPRLLSMIQELPTLAQRNTEAELTNQLKLISAFLALNNSKFGTGKRKTCKTLQSTLAAEGVFLDLRRAIAQLFDVDFSFSSRGQSSSIEVLDQGSLLLDSKPHSDKEFRHLFLGASSEREARTLINELGRALGPKHTAILVDGVVADLFNDCVGRVEKGTSRTGRSQAAWCHEWIGSLTLVYELLNGAFSVALQNGKPKTGKKMKYLKSLATSVLPIVSSSPLWDLPLDVAHGLERDRDANWNNSRALISSADTFSPMALRGNACFTCGLFQVVETMIGLLQKEAMDLIPAVLPPILQKATTTKVACVKEGAHSALENIARSTGFESLGKMIEENMSVVAGSILAFLRLPGGRSSFPVEAVPNEMFEVASTLRAVIELALHGGKEHPKLDTEAQLGVDKSSLSYIIELVDTLTERYDCLASKSRYDSETTLAMVNVYKPSLCYLRVAYVAEETKAKESDRQKLPTEPQPWLEQLSSFRKLEADPEFDTFEDLAAASPREGFEAYQTMKEDEESEDTPTKREPSYGLVSNQEIVFTSMLLSRCSYFLSNSTLRLQLESCTAMARGFEFLAAVTLICKDPDDSSRTAIRRQVNDSWPPTEARLVALTTEIQVSRTSSIVVARKIGMPAAMREMDVSTKRVFLSKLFDLVAIMAQCSEDFMASRFKNDVFPHLSKLLGDFASSEVASGEKSHSIRGDRTQPHCSPRQASETSLIVSMLKCLGGVYGKRKCGKALADLIPTAGTLILPFLGENSEAGTACVGAIKAMCQIDCDALWRPLVRLGERKFPPTKPWETDEGVAGEEDLQPTSLLAQRSQSVLAFIDSIPEQPLF